MPDFPPFLKKLDHVRGVAHSGGQSYRLDHTRLWITRRSSVCRGNDSRMERLGRHRFSRCERSFGVSPGASETTRHDALFDFALVPCDVPDLTLPGGNFPEKKKKKSPGGNVLLMGIRYLIIYFRYILIYIFWTISRVANCFVSVFHRSVWRTLLLRNLDI